MAGAIFGGFAMVLTLLIPFREIYKLHDLVTDKHIDNMCKIILLTGSLVGYAYSMEFLSRGIVETPSRSMLSRTVRSDLTGGRIGR